jgi:DNA-binding transcriptional LysR family regulator
VTLTEAGELLLRHADAIVARLAAARADLQALSGGEAGTLRIGIFQSVGERILPEVIREFSRSWPKVEIALTESASDAELLGLVERGELDLAFADLPLTEGPFDYVELVRDPYVLVVPADSPLAERATAPTATELADLDLIGFRSCRTEQQVEAALKRPLRYVFRADQNGTVQGVVGAGVGVALVPRMTVDATDPRTVVIELGSKVPPRVIALAWHRDRYRTPAARAFVDCAHAVCAERESVAA